MSQAASPSGSTAPSWPMGELTTPVSAREGEEWGICPPLPAEGRRVEGVAHLICLCCPLAPSRLRDAR